MDNRAIPKIIHYTWFSDEPFPARVQECMESWHRMMPDWEFRLWDRASLESVDSCWLAETLKVGKWAFAADYVRLYAVYHFGGIYLDTDVMVYKSFEPLLSEEAFIGREGAIHIGYCPRTEVFLGSHCFGARKGNDYIRLCLDYYDKRHFILSENEDLPVKLRYDMTILPVIQGEIAKTMGYSSSVFANCLQRCGSVNIYPDYFFNAGTPSADSYCHHLALGSWREDNPVDGIQYNLSYKIRWRVVRVLKIIMDRLGYLIVEKE